MNSDQQIGKNYLILNLGIALTVFSVSIQALAGAGFLLT